MDRDIRTLRRRLLTHPLYAALDTPEALCRFQRLHVFAVWDFQTLLLALRRHLTRTELPWIPEGDPGIRRLLNEIVVAEESDEDGRGGHLSHFELYREAMRQSRADVRPIDRFLAGLRRGRPLPVALDACGIPREVRDFVGLTWRIAREGKPHRLAAAFTIGREELIPDLFHQVVRRISRRHPGRFERFRWYLERHIDVDGNEHGPASRRMLDLLCRGSARKRQEALATGREVLESRIGLWDAILRDISTPGTSPREVSARTR